MNTRTRCLCVIAGWLVLQASGAFAQGAPPMHLITPAEMTANERGFYDKLGAGTEAANDFIATRSYVRVCLQVATFQLPASQLPDRPAGFSVKYLLPGDPNAINRAVGYKIAADQGMTPVAHDMTEAQIVKPQDMTQQEQDFYKTLSADDARDFLLTRSYVRLCRQLNDQKLAAGTLPDKPLSFSPTYLLPGEDKVVEDAEKANLSVLMGAYLRQQGH